MTTYINFAILCDPNPGYGIRAMIAADDDGAVIYSRAQHLGFNKRYSNHELSYRTLIAILSWAKANAPGEVVIKSEQELLVRQLGAEWACRAGGLQELFIRAKTLLEETGAKIELIPARDNSPARLLCRMAANQARQARKEGQSNVA